MRRHALRRGAATPRTTGHLAMALLAVGLLGGVLAGCSSSNDPGTTGFVSSESRWVTVPEGDRKPAPPISGPLLHAGAATGTFDLADERGKVVVVNVWGSWCGPCRAEADALQAVYAELADSGVGFVGLNTRDNPRSAVEFLESHGVTYPNVDDSGGALQMGFRSSLPAGGIPTTWIVDAEGRVAARSLGEVTVDGLRSHLAAVLDEGAP